MIDSTCNAVMTTDQIPSLSELVDMYEKMQSRKECMIDTPIDLFLFTTEQWDHIKLHIKQDTHHSQVNIWNSFAGIPVEIVPEPLFNDRLFCLTYVEKKHVGVIEISPPTPSQKDHPQ